MVDNSKKKHPWRACPYGEHWRRGAKVKAHFRGKHRIRAHFRRGGCAVNPTGRDQIYPEEIEQISKREFDSLSKSDLPSAFDLGYKNGNNYDSLIGGWTKYWNQVLKPSPYLDPNLVKALISTESSFDPDQQTKNRSKDKRAFGLMQLLGVTFKILRDENGEIRDHYLNIYSADFKNPSANISAGVRWLIHKYQLFKKNNPKGDWIDAIAKYKSFPRSHKEIKKLESRYNQLKKFKVSSKAK